MGILGEVKINYSKLEKSVYRLGSYLDSLDRVERAIDANSELLSDQRGEAFLMLAERRMAVKVLIAEQRQQALDLKKSISEYKSDMEALVHPMSYSADVRVRRDDIGYNLLQIKTQIDMAFWTMPLPPQQTNPYLALWAGGDSPGSGLLEPDQDRIDRESRNGAKVDNFQYERIPQVKKAIESSLANLDWMHKTKVRAFEDIDNEHAKRAKQLYVKYTDKEQRDADRSRKAKEAVKDFGRGAWGAVKGIGLGLWGLAQVGGAYVVTGGAHVFSVEPPAWTNEKIDGFKARFAGLRGPLDFFELMGQDFCDTYAEEGLAYVAGGAAVDIATIFIPAGAIASKVGSAAKIAGKASKVVKVGEDVADLGRYTKTIKWGIMDIDVRPAGKGFFGKRVPQTEPRVEAYELKINPGNESYYLEHPKGGYVQFENMVNDVVQDGKLVMKQNSFYHIENIPEFGKNKILQEAIRQVEAANNAGYSVEWLVSELKAAEQLSSFFRDNNIEIIVKILLE